MTAGPGVPKTPPFILRARLLTPLDAGGFAHTPDARIAVDATGQIAGVGPWTAGLDGAPVHDLRPRVVMPGMVDLHAHLPQIPNAGLGAGLPLLEWLDRYIFPLEGGFDRATAEAEVPVALRAFAAAGTTTIVAYSALWPESTDASFVAAEAHGIRAVIGKVMMDRVTYDQRIRPDAILETSLRQSAELCERWHGRDEGRLRYAFTPRFAVSCTADMLRESARLAEHYGAYWQTHLSEDAGEIHEVQRCFPEAHDYLEVYERAGGLSDRAILAHAIHLSPSEMERLAASSASVAHCPASNLFLSSGLMQAARYVANGIRVGLGTDLAGGPETSIFGVMRAAAVTQRVLVVSGELGNHAALTPLDWLRLGTLEGARALGLGDRIGSIEAGKEADMILVDPAFTAPLPGGSDPPEPEELMSRLIFRSHPDMVGAAWVRGRLLPS